MHPDRRDRTANLETLAAAGEWEKYYQQLTLWEFGSESRMGFQLAFLRTFAIPRTAKILVQAGHLVNNPLKRAYDTGLIIYELVADGTDGPRGRQMIALMNRSHRGRGIEPVDMTYVLCSFIVVPLRYIERTGWRELTDNDRRASLEFYAEMGRLMNIDEIPATYTEAENFYDRYESAMVAPSPASALLGRKLIAVLRDRLPVPARPIAELVFTTLLDDRRIAEALSLKVPPRPVRSAMRGAMAIYRKVEANLKPRDRPIFVPGMTAGKQYPSGYRLDDLGPGSFVDEGGVEMS